MANNIQGRDLLLEWYDTTAAAFKKIGGVNTRDFTRDNPVSDGTSQSTTGNETESCYVGFSTLSLSGSGVVDTRSSATVAAYKDISTIANSDNPVARFRLQDSLETYDGNFNITSWGKSADQQDLINFTFSLQSAETITYS